MRGEQRRENAAHPRFVEIVDVLSVHPWGDGVEAREGRTPLEDRWDRQRRRRVARHVRILLEILVIRAEACDQVRVGGHDRIDHGPLARSHHGDPRRGPEPLL
jgi:hypothetical protein